MSSTADEVNEQQPSIFEDITKPHTPKDVSVQKKKVTIAPQLTVVGIESYKEYNKRNTCKINLQQERKKKITCNCIIY